MNKITEDMLQAQCELTPILFYLTFEDINGRTIRRPVVKEKIDRFEILHENKKITFLKEGVFKDGWIEND